MSINRRQFLKIAGISSLYGVGAAAGVLWRGGIEASQYSKSPDALKAKRWAMVIDSRKFKTEDDYKKIIHACHSIHNVPDIGDPKEEIKWIWTEKFRYVFPELKGDYMPEGVIDLPFAVLCNHCDNPPCVRVCPTQATFKRKEDGIVMMDYHRCIGCRYCMAGCPYGARSFNYRDPRPFIKEENPKFPTRMIGVVEKCTFCNERIEKGIMPACVEASNGALIFGDLSDPESEVRKVLKTNYTIRRKTKLGTSPSVYYIIGGADNA